MYHGNSIQLSKLAPTSTIFIYLTSKVIVLSISRCQKAYFYRLTLQNQFQGCERSLPHRLEVDLQSLFGLHVHCAVHSCTHWLRPRNLTPSPPHLGSYTRALLVSQDRRHLFVTLGVQARTGAGGGGWAVTSEY
jgi:hypothetical protein